MSDAGWYVEAIILWSEPPPIDWCPAEMNVTHLEGALGPADSFRYDMPLLPRIEALVGPARRFCQAAVATGLPWTLAFFDMYEVETIDPPTGTPADGEATFLGAVGSERSWQCDLLRGDDEVQEVIISGTELWRDLIAAAADHPVGHLLIQDTEIDERRLY